jgi:hypothetical protein
LLLFSREVHSTSHVVYQEEEEEEEEEEKKGEKRYI